MDKYLEQKLKEVLARCKKKMEEVKAEGAKDDFEKGFETGATMVLYELEEFVKTYLS